MGVKAAKNMLLELASKMVGYQRRVGIIHIAHIKSYSPMAYLSLLDITISAVMYMVHISRLYMGCGPLYKKKWWIYICTCLQL